MVIESVGAVNGRSIAPPPEAGIRRDSDRSWGKVPTGDPGLRLWNPLLLYERIALPIGWRWICT
jgi:hypothetical protein